MLERCIIKFQLLKKKGRLRKEEEEVEIGEISQCFKKISHDSVLHSFIAILCLKGHVKHELDSCGRGIRNIGVRHLSRSFRYVFLLSPLQYKY